MAQIKKLAKFQFNRCSCLAAALKKHKFDEGWDLIELSSFSHFSFLQVEPMTNLSSAVLIQDKSFLSKRRQLDVV